MNELWSFVREYQREFICAVAGGSTVEFAKWFWEQTRTPGGRRKQIKGKWIGTGTDIHTSDGSQPMPFECELTFYIGWRRVKAKAKLKNTASPEIEDTLEFEGAFYDNYFLRLNYQSEQKIQLGAVIFELSKGGNTLSGTYAGFSPRRSTIVTGTLELKRPVIPPKVGFALPSG